MKSFIQIIILFDNLNKLYMIFSTYRLYTLYLHKIKEKIIGYGSLTLSKKSSFIFMLVFTAVVVFDSTIVDFSSYSGVEASISVNTAIFIILSIIFAASSSTLNSVRKSTYTSKSSSSLRYFRWIITGVLILTVIIILAIILQMVLLNEYSLILLKLQTSVMFQRWYFFRYWFFCSQNGSLLRKLFQSCFMPYPYRWSLSTF